MKTFIIRVLFSVSAILFLTPAMAIEKSLWHGFDRYDYVIDEQTLQLTPIKAKASEGDGVDNPEPGTRRCIVVVPRQAAPGNPWTWRGCYWNHEPQAEIALLEKGFHVAFITTDPDETWDVWYAFLVKEYKLSPKPAFIGMSRGGSNSFTWGVNHPDKVTAIYADNPGVSQASLTKLHLLAQNDVPLLHICGSTDPILNNTVTIENIYHAWGGRISVIVKDGPAHHPHSLLDPTVIVDFIEQSFAAQPTAKPLFLTERNTRTAFYSNKFEYENKYTVKEKVRATVRGAFFFGSYNRYSIYVEGVSGGVTVIVPNQVAQGSPWVYRADQPERNSDVDFALLAKGYHIVVGPMPTNQDGPNLDHWTAVYNYLTDKGFAKRVVIAGRGAATGEAYEWAINNPDKIACIYGENPVLRASLAKVQPLNNLAPLAKAKTPILHVCGSADPNFKSQTQVAAKTYRQLGGKFTVIEEKGKGHYPLSPSNPDRVVDFIIANTK